MLLWSTRELVMDEWVRGAGAGGLEPAHAGAGRIDKGARGCVLGGNARVSNVAESVLTLARGEQGVELGAVRVQRR